MNIANGKWGSNSSSKANSIQKDEKANYSRLTSANEKSKYNNIYRNTLSISDSTLSISDSTQLTTAVSQFIKHRLIDIIHDGELNFKSGIAQKQKSNKMASQYIINLRKVLDALVAHEVDCLNILRTKLIELKVVELTDNKELYSAFDDMLYDLIHELKAHACIG